MMIPNNNFSCLPFYQSIEEQNARKWWVYNRIYPLFTNYLLPPFQVMRDHIEPTTIPLYDGNYMNGVMVAQSTPSGEPQRYSWLSVDNTVASFINISTYRNNKISLFLPLQPNDTYELRYAFLTSLPQDGERVNFSQGTTRVIATMGRFEVNIPDDAVYFYYQKSQTAGGVTADWTPTSMNVLLDGSTINLFKIYTKDGELYMDNSAYMSNYIYFKTIGDKDYFIYDAESHQGERFIDVGQYYAVMSDGTNTWYSEVFTVVQDLEGYLKLEWWDNQDFIMDAGAIIYKYRPPRAEIDFQFKNVLYLDSNLAKPEYPFEEEGETRDGYFFPIKQISEKRYRFKFFASEYLLDVMRFIRMADNAQITYHGQTYNLDTFLITPQWEDNGDVASVEAEFDTATVAKKIPSL